MRTNIQWAEHMYFQLLSPLQIFLRVVMRFLVALGQVKQKILRWEHFKYLFDNQ